ncbi:MAG: pyruvate flavodoxin/ferredoxin oxidoreductase [Desulfobacteraceae bacterium]|nr:pyruvate flavodoxin/ferredoxin oxidoreductase [Desulfobacteraceae bacterium]
MGLSIMEGNEAIARAAIHAGCRFFAGYPITPATTIYQNMLRFLPPLGGICLQGEDEIASIGFCLGAAMSGQKAMTATSGPGISLYSENISFAIGSEIPLVIVNVQRLGPSTGSATRGADGDVQFMQWGNSGGMPVIVLAPVDVRDCYELTVWAFNLAERYRCPVFLAANKEIAMTRESIDLAKVKLPDLESRRYCDENKPFAPFEIEQGRKAPDFLPIGGSRLVRQTSSTHGEDGYITVDTETIARTQARLLEKLTSTVDDFTFFEADLQKNAKTLILAYGVTSRAAKHAVKVLRQRGQAVSLLILKTLWPVPQRLLKEQLACVDRVVVVEMNLGQYVREIERLCENTQVVFIGQMNGELISPQQIMEVV